MIPKQRYVDGGQIGGTIQMMIQSMFIFNFVTFVNTCAIAYHSFLYEYVSLTFGVIIIIICTFCWWLCYYTIIYPSIITFANRQSYKHNSPIKADILRIENKIDELMNR